MDDNRQLQVFCQLELVLELLDLFLPGSVVFGIVQPDFSIGDHNLTLEVTDGELTVPDDMVLTVAAPPPVEVDLDLRSFKITKDKRTGKTILELRGRPELPELDVSDGDKVKAKVIIQLRDVFQDGGDLKLKDKAGLSVKDTSNVLVIKK